MSIVGLENITISTYDKLYDLIPEDTVELSMNNVSLQTMDICDAFAECIEDLTELESLQLIAIFTPDDMPLKRMDLNRLHALNWIEIVGLNIGHLPDITHCESLRYLEILTHGGYVPSGRLRPSFNIETLLDEVDWSRLHNLSSVYLSSNGITGTLPEWLGDLEKLETLDLSRNKLTGSIPSSFTKHPNLEHLKLHNNSLSGGLEHLKQMSNLVECLLNDNQFTGIIPPTLFKNGGKGGDDKGTFSLEHNQFDTQNLPPKLRRDIRIYTDENISVPPSEKSLWSTRKIEGNAIWSNRNIGGIVYEHIKDRY